MRLIKGDGEYPWHGFTVAQARRSNCGRCGLPMIGFGDPLCAGCSKYWMELMVAMITDAMRKP